MDVVRGVWRKSSDHAHGNRVVDPARILIPRIWLASCEQQKLLIVNILRNTLMERAIVLAGHVTFAVVTIWLLALVTVAAEVRVSGGDVLLLAESP